MVIGIIYAFVSALLLGVYALPSKYSKKFAWENTWGGFFFFGMIVIPLITTFLLVDDLSGIYSQIPTWIFFAMFGMSFCWGIGNIMWGFSISSIGMSLAFSLFLGVITSIDTVLPLILVPEGQTSVIGTPVGNVMLFGIFIIVSGIALNGYAGVLRDRSKSDDQGKPKDARTMKTGILLCVFGAICAAGFNLSYHVGNNIGKIGDVAQLEFGNEPWIARLAVLLPIFMGAALSTMTYFTVTLTKRKTWGNYVGKGALGGLIAVLAMALFHDAALVIYGLGAFNLGELGTSVGFAILETGAIMVASFSGIITNEWKGASRKSIVVLAISLAVLIGGVMVIAKGNYMKIQGDEQVSIKNSDSPKVSS
ncbi:MAG: hypothetical protein JXR03_01765 [Cyclobacteriaceae bacterium]